MIDKSCRRWLQALATTMPDYALAATLAQISREPSAVSCKLSAISATPTSAVLLTLDNSLMADG